ncbi:hypothetical protein K439DRAFT_1625282 [Ramaria rubella]|nr:hypothetical protein K439DRAFT_1625282 [Ramaria rubella]
MADNLPEASIARYLQHDTSESQGTIKALAAVHNEAPEDGMSGKSLLHGPVSLHDKFIPPRCHQALVKYYNSQHLTPPAPHVYLPLDEAAPLDATFLSQATTYMRYVVVHGQRITASYRSHKDKPQSLNSTLMKAHINGQSMYGEVSSLFKHIQVGHPPIIFAGMLWFKTMNSIPIEDDIWANFDLPDPRKLEQPQTGRTILPSGV